MNDALVVIAQKHLDAGYTLKKIAELTTKESGQNVTFIQIDRWLTRGFLKRKKPAQCFVPQTLYDRAQELLDKGLSYSSIADTLSTPDRVLSNTTITEWVKRRKIKKILPDTSTYGDCLELKGDCVICSDSHLPYTDMELVRRMIKMAQKFNIKKLLVAGDLLDQSGLSMKFIESEGDLKAELQAARDFLELLAEWFTEIRLFVGNHDIRLLRLLQFKLGIEDFFKMVSHDLKMSPYPYCKINTGGKTAWYITHPKNYSKIATRVAYFINHREQSHVGVAHGHAMGVSYSPSGGEILFDTGGLFDQKKIKYKNMIDTTHSNWISGFSIIRNGYLYQFPLVHTDWDFWLNMKMPK